jgi:hypothetical protein
VKRREAGNNSSSRSNHPRRKTIEQARVTTGPAGGQRHLAMSKVDKTATNRVAVSARAESTGDSSGDAQGRLPVTKLVRKKTAHIDVAGKRVAEHPAGVMAKEVLAKKPAVKTAPKDTEVHKVAKAATKLVCKKVAALKAVKPFAKKAAGAVGTVHNPTPHPKPRPKESKY